MFATQSFLNDAQPEAETYILKKATWVIRLFIDDDDLGTVKALFESGKFVTKQNIRIFEDYWAQHTKRQNARIEEYIANYRSRPYPENNSPE